MHKHLQKYVVRQPNHRFVFIEKRNELAELFVDSISSSGWTNVIYADNDVLLITNEESRQIILIAHSTKNKIKNGSVLDVFSTYILKDKEYNFSISIIFDISYKDLTKNFKIPQFINWYLSTISMCLESVKPIKELMKKYNAENPNYVEIEKETIALRISLQEKNKILSDSCYEQNINEFFNDEIPS